MAKFEVGKHYEWYQSEYGEIEVLRRTPKYIVVTNGGTTWRMLVKTDGDGNEFVSDSCVPKKWQDCFTCSAKWEVEDRKENGNADDE